MPLITGYEFTPAWKQITLTPRSSARSAPYDTTRVRRVGDASRALFSTASENSQPCKRNLSRVWGKNKEAACLRRERISFRQGFKGTRSSDVRLHRYFAESFGLSGNRAR